MNLKKILLPDRVSIALSGVLCISAALGMAIAHNRLMDAGLVGAREGARVLALPGFAAIGVGVVFVGGALGHAWLERRRGSANPDKTEADV
jgi:hypothetical protein